MKSIVTISLFILSFSALAQSQSQWSSGNIYQDVWRNGREIYKLQQENTDLKNQVNNLEQKVYNLESRLIAIEKRFSPKVEYTCSLRLTDKGRSILYIGKGETEARARAELRKQCLDDRIFRPSECNSNYPNCRRTK